MFDLDKIVRQNIRELKAYESARSLLNLKDYTLLDSNENPFGSYNRYPDNNYPRLKKYLSKFLDTSRKNIFLIWDNYYLDIDYNFRKDFH